MHTLGSLEKKGNPWWCHGALHVSWHRQISGADALWSMAQAAAEAPEGAVAGLTLLNCAGGMNNKVRRP